MLTIQDKKSAYKISIFLVGAFLGFITLIIVMSLIRMGIVGSGLDMGIIDIWNFTINDKTYTTPVFYLLLIPGCIALMLSGIFYAVGRYA